MRAEGGGRTHKSRRKSGSQVEEFALKEPSNRWSWVGRFMMRNAKRVQGRVNECGDIAVEAVRSDSMEEDSGAVRQLKGNRLSLAVAVEDAAVTMKDEAQQHEQDAPG
ncbi:hypothetical protein PC121_g1478 [Phytophthora cactorum]|nr:hypothetical protein PC120_g9 [Phytophthora cactorum]KAG3101354.1 hypothetical protein PC121_g1478 [Phytophthora cactorum]KAG4064745.1 hypothetical protein PC123_g544 [Phytophthora cactorum]